MAMESWLRRYDRLIDQRKDWIEGKGVDQSHRRFLRFMTWKEKPYTPTTPRRHHHHYFIAASNGANDAYELSVEFGMLINQRKRWKIYKGKDGKSAMTEKLFWKRMGQ
jgi:hypothetical protein